MEPSVDPQLIADLMPVMQNVVFTHPLVVQNKHAQPDISPEQLAGVLATVIATEIMNRLAAARQSDPSIRAMDIATDPIVEYELMQLVDQTISYYLVPINESASTTSPTETSAPSVDSVAASVESQPGDTQSSGQTPPIA